MSPFSFKPVFQYIYEIPWRFSPGGAGSGPVHFRDGSWVTGYRPARGGSTGAAGPTRP